jgi:serine/threonine-protein kinase
MWELTRCGRIFGVFSDRWHFDDPPWDSHSTDVKDDEIGFRCVARFPVKIAEMTRIECVTLSFDEGRKTYDMEYLRKRDFSGIRRPALHVQKPFGDFVGDVIVDTDTGLMWEMSGSDSRLTYEGAANYVHNLNCRWFAGYDGWRLPTIPELASLLRRDSSSGGFCIDPIFGRAQLSYWSSDRGSPDYSWYVNFMGPDINTLRTTQELSVRPVRTKLLFEFQG